MALAVGLILACASVMPAWAVVLISTAAGAFCACAVGYRLAQPPGQRHRQAPERPAQRGGENRLRFHEDARANERAPGEIGQLGRAH